MPKVRRRKGSSFEISMTKSVFLYGDPNVAKRMTLKQIESEYCKLVTQNISALRDRTDVTLQLIKNDKKDSEIRKIEKAMRPAGVNSAFAQNAFDAAFTHLSNRLNDIRNDMMRRHFNIFIQSKALFAMSIDGKPKADMIKAMEDISNKQKNSDNFYHQCAEELSSMSDEEFKVHMDEFHDDYFCTSLEFKVPELKRAEVPFDSRLMKIEASSNIKASYVITLTDPFRKGKRFSVPLNTSAHSLHKIKSNDMAGTVKVCVRNRKLRVAWSYGKKMEQPETDKLVGVDTGITDSFHTSDDVAIGSMKDVIDFYKQTVEPSFAGLSDLRNKKRKIKHYLRTHKSLPEDVRCSLIKKMDKLEQMIQKAEAPYRKDRHYKQMLAHEIRKSVRAYIKDLPHDTLTVLERLDIKEFDKSRRVNGMFSMFARGQLQKTLMTTLNWYGYDFMEVEPAYTSQVCPRCSNLNKDNRDGKRLHCTCCGYAADADYVGSLNIKARATDNEILAACKRNQHNQRNMQNALKAIYADRHAAYLKDHPEIQAPVSTEDVA